MVKVGVAQELPYAYPARSGGVSAICPSIGSVKSRDEVVVPRRAVARAIVRQRRKQYGTSL